MADETIETTAEKKARLLAARDAQKAAEETEREDHEVQFMELEDQFEAELGGPRGKAFEIIDANAVGCGFLVVKLIAGIAFKRFRDAINNPKTDHDKAIFDFVFPAVVYPSQDTFKKINVDRPQVTNRCSDALIALFGAKDADQMGKY